MWALVLLGHALAWPVRHDSFIQARGRGKEHGGKFIQACGRDVEDGGNR